MPSGWVFETDFVNSLQKVRTSGKFIPAKVVSLEVKLPVVAYVDDTNILATLVKNLQILSNVMHDFCRISGIETNDSKEVIISFNHSTLGQKIEIIELDRKVIHVLTTDKIARFLGNWISYN